METKHNQVVVKNSEGQNILATGKFVGKKSWNGFSSSQHNRITIKNLDTGKYAYFDYWGSIREPSAENRRGVVDALYCLASDASSAYGSTSLKDFCDEFGYDIEERQSERIYKACQALGEKFDRVIGGSSDNYDIFYALGDEDYNYLVSEGKVLLNY